MDSSKFFHGRTRVKRVALVATATLWLGAAPASAQIITTSIPRVEPGGSQADEKKFAVHVMASPFSKWHYNEIVSGQLGTADVYDIGIFSGTPNSDFLLAGEVVAKVGRNFSVGGGSWYNKVGKVNYDFDVTTYTGDAVAIDRATGTLTGDLKLSEYHVNGFYKDIGVQTGWVRTKSTLSSSVIRTSKNFPQDVGKALGSIESSGEEATATDWDLYGVYKYAGQTGKMPFGLSAGAGAYKKKGSTDTSQRAAEDQTVFSGFLTGTVDLYKGIGVDLSYWYIAKTKADLGVGQPVSSQDPSSRFTIGFSYTFSK